MALHLDMAMRTVTDLRSGKRSDKSDKSDNAKPLPLSGYSAHEPIHRPIQLDNSDDSSNDEDECSACHEEGELFRCGGCRKRFHEMCDPLPPDVSMSQLLRRKKRRCGYCEATKPREQPDKDLSDRDTVHDLMDDSDDESSNDDDLDGNLEGFIVTSDSEVSDGERGDYNKASVKPVSDSDVGESDFDPESDHTVATNNDVRVNGSKRRITRGYSSGSHGNGGISVVEIQHSDIDSDHSVVNLHNTRTKKMRQIESELESDAESIPSDAELDMVVVDEGKNGSDRDGNVANHDSDDVVDDGNHSNLNVVSIAHEGDHSDQNSNHSDQDSESDDNEIEKHAIENMSDSEAQDSGEDSDDQMM
ncbi:hypothetical protein SARC_03112 [Sphaeroforma arctica JP610]|uniref:PHD-type domain-containing protein n=1 Tax=Sphaeroforma arctica JP610 TaxID=667725 RepID=A0A0L0G8W3_9EUKA|nr:hypothetical protein SARC_03112 [Sphaeroforma arctica JP610]KNC84678.1 hypothetical protein SARC_03112 [Sphaeroforma arctica JP610]|eukprot:XP_014158580.1 hypothetical protein SARC_03112 [Sphaeroforma arctica JP610]